MAIRLEAIAYYIFVYVFLGLKVFQLYHIHLNKLVIQGSAATSVRT